MSNANFHPRRRCRRGSARVRNSKPWNIIDRLYEKMDLLEMRRDFTARSVNEGFPAARRSATKSCKWRCSNRATPCSTKPTAGWTSTRSRSWRNGVNTLRGPNLGVLLITHYQRLLNYIVPDRIHVMMDGRIVRSGDKSLALELDEKGYDWLKPESEALATA